MGTGISEREVVSNSLGSMYGMLVFFESSVDGLLSSSEDGRTAKDLFPGEIDTLADALFGLGMATKAFERLVGQLSGADKAAFVCGVASAAQRVSDRVFNGASDSNERE